ncbi:MAG: hypothetical protein MJ092_07780 [Lachnospiraceae bacterium]|nr:hypothetical protein [Lachnospiraceae bacterium]
MTEKTKITVYFRKERMRYRSLFQYSNSKNNNKIQTEYETDSGWESAESVNEIFPIQIRSQKEIFELTTNPKQLIEMVNGVPEIGYAQWDQKRQELDAKYVQLCKEVRDAEELIETRELVSRKLNEIDRKIGCIRAMKIARLSMIIRPAYVKNR